MPSLEEPTIFESNMMRFSINEDVARADYVQLFLTSDLVRHLMRKWAKEAVAQASINQQDIKSLPIILPSLPEQCEIAGLFHACDAKIAALDREVDILEELFQTLLGELISGRRSTTALLDEHTA